MFIPSIIKSIQRGTIPITGTGTTNTATLGTAVVTAYSVVSFLGVALATDSGGGVTYQAGMDLVLTNTTTITSNRQAPGTNATSTISFEVIEFYPSFIKSIQNKTLTVSNGSASGTVALTSIVTGKTMLFYQGYKWTSTLGSENIGEAPYIVLTSSILITATRASSTNGTYDIKVTAVEFR